MADDSRTWYDPGVVKPRQRDSNPRCQHCKDGPMFHPAHPWGPCDVKPAGGELCGCTEGVEQPAC